MPDDYARAENALRDGQVEAGLSLLRASAERGGVRAGLRLGKIYAEGKLVARDEARACELYRALADRYAQIDKADPAARLVAEAFRLWAFCYLKGGLLPTGEQNFAKAAVLLYQSGVLLDDPESLYELAKMYLKGEGVAPNPRLAVHYLWSASRKRFAPAQAMLGALMWEGKVLKLQRVNGLAMLKFALDAVVADNNHPEEKGWIDRQFEEALITATKTEEADAMRLVEEWKKAYGPANGNSPLVVATPPAQATPPAAAPSAVAGAPLPSRAPGQGQSQPQQQAPRQAANPPAPVSGPRPVQQNSFGTLPTGADIPANLPAKDKDKLPSE